MPSTEQTRAQIERSLSQQMQSFYREQIGQRPSKAICQILDESLVAVLHDTVSPAERALLNAGRAESAKQLRGELHEVLKPHLKALIQQIIDTPIITVLLDSDLDSGFSSLTAILESTPTVRDPESIPKRKVRGALAQGLGTREIPHERSFKRASIFLLP